MDDFGAELYTDGGVVIELEFFFEELKKHTTLANT